MTTQPTQPNLISSEVIDPDALSASARRELIDELHATHAQIFAGVSREEFAKYVVESPAERTRIEVYRAAGRVVGYFAVHTFVRVIDGERWVVLRAESGKLPAFRRGARGLLMIREVLRACVLYPRARKAYLGCFVHLSAYVAMGHVAPQMYPHWDQPTPAPLESAMDQLAADFDLDRVDPSRSGVRKVGWITREDESTRQSWARRTCEMSRFYMRANPGYVDGHGLVVLVPLNLRDLIDGSLRLARRALRRQLGARAQLPALGRTAR